MFQLTRSDRSRIVCLPYNFPHLPQHTCGANSARKYAAPDPIFCISPRIWREEKSLESGVESRESKDEFVFDSRLSTPDSKLFLKSDRDAAAHGAARVADKDERVAVFDAALHVEQVARLEH